MKIIITAAGVIGMLACLVAMQSQPSQEIMTLRKQLADIGLRVSRLEHAAGVTPGAVDDSNANASADNVPRSMVLAGMGPGEPRPVDQDEVNDLKADADSLLQTSNFHKDNQDRVAGDTYYVGGYYSDGHYGYNHSNDGRERQEIAQRQMANQYATQASIKRQEAKRLENAKFEPHQIINGHDGDVVFTLRTKHDLTEKLNEMNIGDVVTWTGTRVSADSTSETWDISSISKVP